MRARRSSRCSPRKRRSKICSCAARCEAERRVAIRRAPRAGSRRYTRYVLLSDAPLTLREYMSREEIPLATIFREVFAFIEGRDDVVVFGAHAVNAYAQPERMT